MSFLRKLGTKNGKWKIWEVCWASGCVCPQQTLTPWRFHQQLYTQLYQTPGSQRWESRKYKSSGWKTP